MDIEEHWNEIDFFECYAGFPISRLAQESKQHR